MTIKKRAEHELRSYSISRSAVEQLTKDIQKRGRNIRELRASRLMHINRCRSIEHGLAALTDQQRRILELFYLKRCSGHILELSEELQVESAQVYRRKDEALKDYIFAVYGIES